MSFLNFPIDTEEAIKFWSSSHRSNKVKAIIAFSTDLDNANDNLRRHGYTNSWRKESLDKFGEYVNQPDMKNIPFSTTEDSPW